MAAVDPNPDDWRASPAAQECAPRERTEAIVTRADHTELPPRASVTDRGVVSLVRPATAASCTLGWELNPVNVTVLGPAVGSGVTALRDLPAGASTRSRRGRPSARAWCWGTLTSQQFDAGARAGTVTMVPVR